MKDKYRLKDWQELPLGGVVIEGGNSADYETGTWRTSRPVWMEENCINCLSCWVFCPDSAIMVEDSKIAGIDYKHCKGCGICAHECPDKVKAYTMVQEGKEE